MGKRTPPVSHREKTQAVTLQKNLKTDRHFPGSGFQVLPAKAVRNLQQKSTETT